MSKDYSFFLFLLIILFIFPLSISSEESNATNENITLNDTNQTFESMDDFNPFKNFDFGNVIWLDDSNATSMLKDNNSLLYVVFYSPWCGHCHKFMPEYVRTSKYAEEKNLTIKFAKIDASVSPNTSEEFHIEGIPAVFLINKGQKYLYEGVRTLEGLLKFMKRKINNDLFIIETLKELKEYIDSSPLILLSTLKNKSEILYRSFIDYSKVGINVDFVSCITDECIKEYNEDIILFKNFDEKINKYSEDMGKKEGAHINSIRDFIGIYGIENGANLTAKEINMMFDHSRKMIFYFRNSSIEEQTKVDKIIKELGKEYRNKKIYTVISDIEGEPLQENVANTFIVVKQDLPTLLFYDLKTNYTNDDMASIYTIRPATFEQLKKENIKEYIDNILNGKIKKDLYSEPPLDNYNINGLKYIIGRTFDKEVIEEKNNVILTLIDGSYLTPETEKVLDIMRNLTKKYTTEEKKIVFAYTDAAKNQPRDVELKGEMPPLVLLYTNAMSEKKVIKLNHQNFTLITEGDVEGFLTENLNWEKNEEKKEEIKEEIKESKKEENKEEKKETDL